MEIALFQLMVKGWETHLNKEGTQGWKAHYDRGLKNALEEWGKQGWKAHNLN